MMTIAINGAAGRMGRELVRAVALHPGLKLVAASVIPGSGDTGKDAGIVAGLEPLGVALTEDQAALAQADAAIDFTAPAASLALAPLIAARGGVHIVGTTGFTPEQKAQLQAHAKQARIVQSGNMSLGVNLLQKLVEQAARTLPGFDVEIVELHHKHKVDAPSGTALMLGEAVARGRGQKLEDKAVYTREGHTGLRPEGAIGFAVLRGGDAVGEHSVMLAGTGERIELKHAATSRAVFAEGAIAAALWAVKQKPGYYSMQDVLGSTL